MKFCPYKDCKGYGERKNKNEKFIKCNKGHKFYFNCLKNCIKILIVKKN